MNRRQRVLLMLTVAAGLGAAGSIGWAFFSAPGSGHAVAAVGSLGTPTSVTVPSAVVGSTVHVSWTGVAAPDGSTPVAYWVQRFSGSTPANACGSSHASPVAVGAGAKSCDDTTVAPGTYTYTVTAVFRSWTAASVASGSVVVDALDHFSVSAPSSATAGTAFSVTVAAQDSSNITINAYTGTVHFASSDVHSSSLPADYTFVAGDHGSHTFSSAVTLDTAGSQTVSVNDTAQTSKVGTSGTIAVSGAGLDHFVVTGPASATAGTAFSTTTVAAVDAFGNAASAWKTATQCVTFGGPANAPSGTSPSYPAAGGCAAGQSSLSFDGSGHATAAGITLYNAQSVALTVTASSKTGSSSPIAVGAAGIDHFTVVAPATATVATAFTSATATAQDLYNNPASGWTSSTKCVTFSGPGNAPNGTAPNYPAQGSCSAGQSSLAFDASGQASGFSVTLYKAETHTLTITDPATLKTGTSSNVVVGAGPAASFLVTAPASATAGTQFGVTSLTARDAYSNTAPGYTGTHTIVWSGPGNAPNATAPTFPATAVSFTSGVSTTTLNATLVKAESATLTASESSGPSGSASITVNPGATNNFLVSAPSSATAGTAFSVTSLTARDSFNNTAAAYTGAHTITWSGPGNAPSGTAPTFPATSVTFSNGVSTTTLSATLVKAESATLTAKEGVSPSGSASITVNPGTAANFLVTAPASATAGSSYTVTSLTARDSFNNTATAYTGTHTITWSGPGTAPDGTSATLPTQSVSFTAGVSTTSLTATLVKAETATLTAKEGVSPSGSVTITVSAGAASKLQWSTSSVDNGSLVSGPTTCTWTSAGRGKHFTGSLAVTDAHGNVVSDLGAGHTVSLGSTASGGFSPTSLAIPASGPAITASFTYTTNGSNSWSTDTVTASSAPYTSATVAITK